MRASTTTTNVANDTLTYGQMELLEDIHKLSGLVMTAGARLCKLACSQAG